MKPLTLPELSAGGADVALNTQRLMPRLGTAAWTVVFSLLAVLAWDATGLDLSVVRWFGDIHGFAWRDHWFTSGVLHQGGRWVATGLVVMLLVNAVRPLWPGLTRRERWVAVLATAICLIAIPLIKQGSTTSCPWDLAEFGGTAHYVSHWRLASLGGGLGDGGPGHCFPSGHASSAFAFFSLFFMLRRAYPWQARAALVGVLAMGLLYGTAQLARGAHYPSHTLWTGWICWAITVGFVALTQLKAKARAAA